MRYFITFACYGTHMHGDESGSVDKQHNAYGSRVLEPDPARLRAEQLRMKQPPYELAPASRAAVLEAIRQDCSYRGWTLLAAHVRTNHVHVIVESDVTPERIMNDLKSYASRKLNQIEPTERKRWARHGSTRYLWKDHDELEAMRCVIEGQGEPMATYVAEWIWR